MALNPENIADSLLGEEFQEFLQKLPQLRHGKWLARSFKTLSQIALTEIDRLDWKILTGTIEDLEQGFTIFSPYRNTRKITIFGSARISPHTPEYKLALDFAQSITNAGFMVLTGGGAGIMQAANEGAGRDNSFGLNIQLPFEQGSNPYIADEKSINFKYFFTRKLFFLRESDAVALFPGGFGTQDEAFETLTLCQTGKYGPAPLVLIDLPGDDYWSSWNDYICKQCIKRGLVSEEDKSLYTITDDVTVACNTITQFYRVYHSSRYVGNKFVMRLNAHLSDTQVEMLNQEFSDFLVDGSIVKTKALPEESNDFTDLPRLLFQYNPRHQGRLYQLINKINQLEVDSQETEHPERK